METEISSLGWTIPLKCGTISVNTRAKKNNRKKQHRSIVFCGLCHARIRMHEPGLLRRAIWDKHWGIDWVARSRRCELMAQIISGFTKAALHRPPPLLCNLGSPWRTQGSHSSKGKQVRKYCFASRSHMHERTRAQAHWGQITNLQTYCRYLHVARIYTPHHNTRARTHTHTHTHTHTQT